MSKNKTLVLAEKPSVGRDIARVLGAKENGNGFLENDHYVVTWALGHLVSLADPEAYGEQYKTWSMETLPMLPSPMKLVVLKGGGKQFNIVKKLLNRNDVTTVVIATDAGREGELVARWILKKAHCNKPIKRLWISSVTDKAIREGFHNLKDGRDYTNLYRAAQCRAEGDWLVGMNVTRALTVKYNAQLSAGRVQSATLNMIVERQQAIKNFVPETYYQCTANWKGICFTWQGKHGKNIRQKDFADRLLQRLKGKPATVTDCHQTQHKVHAAPLYDLTELQRDASRLFHFSPKETLNIMQRLYEQHKILTYPRTDSRYLTDDIVPTLKDRLEAIAVGPYKKASREILSKGIRTSKRIVDNTKVSDHHAIIPTEERVFLSQLNDSERKIYDLVIRRFLSVFLPPAVYYQTTLCLSIDHERFTASVKEMADAGYQKIAVAEDDETAADHQSVPSVHKGDLLEPIRIELQALKTQPPLPFTEATLLSAMENPQKIVKVDAQAARTLGATGGIGTVATRGDIIEKLYKSFVIEKKGNALYPTSKGIQLIRLVPEDLKSPLMTAQWEHRLELISKGESDPNAFIRELSDYTSHLVADIRGSDSKFVHDNMTRKKCPECGKYLLEVKGKHGNMYVCQDRACGYRETISRNTNVRCPECHVKMEMQGKGDKAYYVCKRCGFKEKVNSFNKKHFDKQKLNKKEARHYMQKMQKENEALTNNPFAEALAKLKNS